MKEPDVHESMNQALDEIEAYEKLEDPYFHSDDS